MAKSLCLVFLIFFVFYFAAAELTVQRSEKAYPFRNGIRCNGCPLHYCDDDPSVIFGYCCGCAKLNDNLPIKCDSIVCPLNTYETCTKYEYMMTCCCSRF